MREEGLLKRTEMRMLRWILEASLKNKKRNEVIGRIAEEEVRDITNKKT